jgi:hypothetical protein
MAEVLRSVTFKTTVVLPLFQGLLLLLLCRPLSADAGSISSEYVYVSSNLWREMMVHVCGGCVVMQAERRGSVARMVARRFVVQLARIA